MSETRFDLVWRRIVQDAYAREFEQSFEDRHLRLDRMNNWGVLAWLHPHAEASKQSHHYGVERNVEEFLSRGDVGRRRKYARSIRAAAHVLHWGHMPLGFAGDEALLRLAHIDPDARELLDSIVEEVSEAVGLTCADEDHDCVWEFASDANFYAVYRWLSAWLVVEEWDKVWDAICRASEITPGANDEVTVKSQLVRALVCAEDRGFRVLTMCNKADFVPRDLLQSGTAWLSLDIETLWETNPLGSDAAPEWALIDSASSYLNQRFYSTPQSLLVHSLSSRAIAGAMRSGGVSKSRLRDWLKGTDSFFESKTVVAHHRDRLRKIRAATRDGSLLEDWRYMGPFHSVTISKGNRFDLEDELSGRAGAARASYPFTRRVNIDAQVDRSWRKAEYLQWENDAIVHVHQNVGDGADIDATAECLAIASRIRERISFSEKFGDAVMTWLTGDSYDSNAGKLAEIGRAYCDLPEFRAGLTDLGKREIVRKQLAGAGVEAWCRYVLAAGESDYSREDAWEILKLPWRAVRLAGARRALEAVRAHGLSLASSNDQYNGYGLELAVAASQWIEDSDPDHRFVFLNSQALTEERLRGRELDVIRVDVHSGPRIAVTVIECSLDNSAAKRVRETRSLRSFRESVKSRFGDAIVVNEMHARLATGDIDYQPMA